jgi:hypothetical protein
MARARMNPFFGADGDLGDRPARPATTPESCTW